jgi:hypothetical protein
MKFKYFIQFCVVASFFSYGLFAGIYQFFPFHLIQNVKNLLTPDISAEKSGTIYDQYGRLVQITMPKLGCFQKTTPSSRKNVVSNTRMVYFLFSLNKKNLTGWPI